jgi:hypothetical protein
MVGKKRPVFKTLLWYKEDLPVSLITHEAADAAGLEAEVTDPVLVKLPGGEEVESNCTFRLVAKSRNNLKKSLLTIMARGVSFISSFPLVKCVYKLRERFHTRPRGNFSVFDQEAGNIGILLGGDHEELMPTYHLKSFLPGDDLWIMKTKLWPRYLLFGTAEEHILRNSGGKYHSQAERMADIQSNALSCNPKKGDARRRRRCVSSSDSTSSGSCSDSQDKREPCERETLKSGREPLKGPPSYDLLNEIPLTPKRERNIQLLDSWSIGALSTEFHEGDEAISSERRSPGEDSSEDTRAMEKNQPEEPSSENTGGMEQNGNDDVTDR